MPGMKRDGTLNFIFQASGDQDRLINFLAFNILLKSSSQLAEQLFSLPFSVGNMSYYRMCGSFSSKLKRRSDLLIKTD